MGLVQMYESCFSQHGLHTAQVLLTHDDLSDRKRYLNARSTLRTLLSLGVIPIINENDTVVTDEIRFGDNLPKTRSGKIMRRLLRSLAKGEEITADISTLDNPAILEQLKQAVV